MDAGSAPNWVRTRGVFSTTAVARLLGRRSAEIARWISGDPPLIEPGLPKLAGRLAMTFDALVEARAVSFLLEQGLPRRRLARLQQTLRQRSGSANPLALDRTIRTDGAAVFEDNEGRLIDLLNDAYAHPDILQPGLMGRLAFQAGVAAWLEPFPDEMPLVRIQPTLAFGRPVVLEGGRAIPTSTVAAIAANEGVAGSADWFGLSCEAAAQAVRFEEKLAA
jgi:hypothetical protein